VLEFLAGSITDVKTAAFTPGMFRTEARMEGDTVVVVVASRDLPRDCLRQRTILRARIEKYRLKAQRCIGFGVMANDSSQVFDCAVRSDETWQYDSAMEELVANQPPFISAPGTKKPGRNSPCPCGRGMKVKKCCLKRFEIGQRMLNNSPKDRAMRTDSTVEPASDPAITDELGKGVTPS
jgi:SEC-C motif